MTEHVLIFSCGSEFTTRELAALNPVRRERLGYRLSVRVRLSGYGNACLHLFRKSRRARRAA